MYQQDREVVNLMLFYVHNILTLTFLSVKNARPLFSQNFSVDVPLVAPVVANAKYAIDFALM